MGLAKTTTLTAYFGLLILLTAKFTLLRGDSEFPAALSLLILVGPLLLPLRGTLHGRSESVTWLCLLPMVYFSIGVFNAAGSSFQNWIPRLEIGFSVLLFLGSLVYVRGRNRQLASNDATAVSERSE